MELPCVLHDGLATSKRVDEVLNHVDLSVVRVKVDLLLRDQQPRTRNRESVPRFQDLEVVSGHGLDLEPRLIRYYTSSVAKLKMGFTLVCTFVKKRIKPNSNDLRH